MGQLNLRWNWNDKRPVPCHCETGACLKLPCLLPVSLSSHAAAVLKRPVRYSRSNRIVGNAKQVNRSAGDAEEVRDAGETVPGLADTSCQWDCREFGVCRGMGFRDAVVNPVATSLQTLMRLGD